MTEQKVRWYQTSFAWIAGVGGLEILLVYLLLVVESPVSAWTRRTATTAMGRVVIALIAFMVVVLVMIAVLSAVEAIGKRRRDTP